MKTVRLYISFLLMIITASCSPSSGLSKTEVRQTKIDSTFTHYEQLGLNTRERLKYIYHFSDRERIPLQELEKGLERDGIEVIRISNTMGRRPWHLFAFENRVHSRSSMAEREKYFRLKMFSYKVDDYNGFTIAPADIDISAVPNDQFLPFILSLDNDDLFNVGIRLDKLKDYQKSMFVFDELIRREYRQDTSYFKMGAALIGTHEYVKGIELWLKAIDLNPDYLEAHMQLGIIFFENSHWKQAHKHFREADRIKPNDDVILYHLAKSLIKLERYNEAFTAIKRSVKIDGKNVHARGVLKRLKTPVMKKFRRQELKIE